MKAVVAGAAGTPFCCGHCCYRFGSDLKSFFYFSEEGLVLRKALLERIVDRFCQNKRRIDFFFFNIACTSEFSSAFKRIKWKVSSIVTTNEFDLLCPIEYTASLCVRHRH